MNGLLAFLSILLVWLGLIGLCKIVDKIIEWRDKKSAEFVQNTSEEKQ